MTMKSRQMALCGVLAALSVCFLLLGSVIPGATFCGPLLAMTALVPVLEECGPRMAGATWGAVSLLGLLLAADRELALVYLFFGWYPILRPRIAKLPLRSLRVLCRLAVCSGMAALLYGLAMKVLGLPTGLEEESGWMLASLLVMANVTFLIADLVLDRQTRLWNRRLRKRFFR